MVNVAPPGARAPVAAGMGDPRQTRNVMQALGYSEAQISSVTGGASTPGVDAGQAAAQGSTAPDMSGFERALQTPTVGPYGEQLPMPELPGFSTHMEGPQGTREPPPGAIRGLAQSAMGALSDPSGTIQKLSDFEDSVADTVRGGAYRGLNALAEPFTMMGAQAGQAPQQQQSAPQPPAIPQEVLRGGGQGQQQPPVPPQRPQMQPGRQGPAGGLPPTPPGMPPQRQAVTGGAGTHGGLDPQAQPGGEPTQQGGGMLGGLFSGLGDVSPEVWRGLLDFGLATMQAGGQPGATALGAIGQGGSAAMQGAQARKDREALEAAHKHQRRREDRRESRENRRLDLAESNALESRELERARFRLQQQQAGRDPVKQVVPNDGTLVAITQGGNVVDLELKAPDRNKPLDPTKIMKAARDMATLKESDQFGGTTERFDPNIYNQMTTALGAPHLVVGPGSEIERQAAEVYNRHRSGELSLEEAEQRLRELGPWFR